MSFKHRYMLTANVLARHFSKSILRNANHYKALGLNPSASPADIKEAYYRLSKIYHPDRNNGSEASAKMFREISAAYEVLSKSESRRNYDKEKFRGFDSRKQGNNHTGNRNRGNKRNRNGVSAGAGVKASQDLRWKPRSTMSVRTSHKINSKEMEAAIVKSLRILFMTMGHYGNR